MEGGLKIAEKTTVDKGEFGRLKHSDGGDTIIAEAMRQSGMYEGKSLEELKGQAMKLDVEEYNKILEAGRQKRAERRAQHASQNEQGAKRADGVQMMPTDGTNNVAQNAIQAARIRASAPGAKYALGSSHDGVDPVNHTGIYKGGYSKGSDRWKGTTLQNTYDCSGFVGWAYRDAGVNIPKWNPTTAYMRKEYEKVGFKYYDGPINKSNLSQLQPGDVLLREAAKTGKNNGHTEIYTGNGRIIGAHSSGSGVTETNFSGSYTGYLRYEGKANAQKKPKTEQEKIAEQAKNAAESVKRVGGMQVSANQEPPTPISAPNTPGATAASAPIQAPGNALGSSTVAPRAQSAKAIMDSSSNTALSNAAIQRDKAKSQPIVVPMPAQQNQPINVHAGRNMEGQTAGPMNMAPEPSIITRMIEAEYFAQM